MDAIKIIVGIILGTGMLFVILIGGAFLLSKYEITDDVKKDVEEKRLEGANFGKTTDQQGCLKEGLERSKKASPFSLKETYPVSVFVKSCLPESRPTSGFCNKVPANYDFAHVEDWKTERCEASGLSETNSSCSYVFEQQIDFCSRRN